MDNPNSQLENSIAKLLSYADTSIVFYPFKLFNFFVISVITCKESVTTRFILIGTYIKITSNLVYFT